MIDVGRAYAGGLQRCAHSATGECGAVTAAIEALFARGEHGATIDQEDGRGIVTEGVEA